MKGRFSFGSKRTHDIQQAEKAIELYESFQINLVS